MIRDDEPTYGVSYWPSVSDLFLTLFVIAIALVGSVVFVVLPNPEDPTVQEQYLFRLQGEIDGLKRKLEDVESRELKARELLAKEIENKERLERRLAEVARAKGLEEKPPIITIADADKRHFFESGKSIVSQDFEKDLRDGGFLEIADEILKRNSDGTLNVDTLEVIGHTDGVPVSGRGNLDEGLPAVLVGMGAALNRLTPGSNNDLGLLRALAIKQAWQRFVAGHIQRLRLGEVEVRTYSAGQTLPVELGHFSTEDPRARRIELRLTRLR